MTLTFFDLCRIIMSQGQGRSNCFQKMTYGKLDERENVSHEKNGKKKVVLRKLIPCYVFIKMIFNNDLWYVITNIKGVTGFVGPQGRLLPLTEDEVKRMGLETKVEIENINFAVGDNVKIVSGPLESFVGVINSLNFASQKANVKVDMFGRDTDVELDFVQIQRIDV